MSEHLTIWEKLQQFSDLVKHVPPHVLEQVAQVAYERTFEQGEALFHQGEMPNTVYFLLNGAVALEKHEKENAEPVVVTVLRPPELVGDHSAYYQHPYPYDAIALEPTVAIAIPAIDFINMVEAAPKARGALGYRTESPVSRAKRLLPDLRDDEKILFVQRRHWILLLRRLLLGPLSGILLATLLVVIGIVALPSLPVRWLLGGWFVLMLILIPWLAWVVADWLNDYFIVTNQRAIHIEKVILYKEERREAPFEKVQDVQLEQATIINTILDYGNVRIATASNSAPIVFDYVPHPAVVQRLLTEHRDRFATKVRQRAEEEKRRRLRRALGLEPPAETAPQSAAPAEGAKPSPSEQKRRFFPLHYLGRWLAMTTYREDGTILWRKHWIALIWDDQAWKPALFILLSILGMITMLLFLPDLSRLPRWMEWGLWGAYFVFLLFGWAWLLWTIEDWRNDVYILTNDSIVDEEREPLGFDVHTRRAPLTTIQDISYQIPNMLYTLLDVGHVVIETASQEGKLTFDFVHHPREVSFHIYQRIRDLEEEERVRQQARLDESILEILKLYNEEVVEKRLPPSTSQAS